MNRRAFLAAASAMLAADRVRAQDTTRTGGAADPLMDPNAVGQLRAVATPLDNEEAIKAIESKLKCTCGCNLDIFTCRTTDFTCTYSPELHKEIVGLYAGGMTGDQIIAAFVAKHGEQVLLAPDARGFNLVGYLAPSAAVLLAGGTLAFVLLRRHRERTLARQTVLAGPSTGPGTLSEDQRARLDRALGELDQ